MSLKDIRNRLRNSNYVIYSVFNFLYKHAKLMPIKIKSEGCYKFVKDVVGRNNQIIIGKNTFVDKAHIFIRGNNNTLILGDNVRIGRGSAFRFVGNNLVIKIGNNTTMNSKNGLIASQANITIGENCMISNHVMIRTSDDHSIKDLKTGAVLGGAKDVIIGDHVWLTPECIIMKGVTIENDSIIATRAIVTHNVKSNCIVAGIPAKVTKEGITWEA